MLAIFALVPEVVAESPVDEGWYTPIAGCRDTWVIDGRDAPDCGNLAEGMSKLRFYRAQRTGLIQFWSERSQEQFLATADGSLPTTYFFHGYGLGKQGAVFSAERLAEYIGENAPPFRLVIWIWPARHRLLASTQTNIREKTVSADAQGYYLASLVRQMDPQATVTLAGHSFGARCVLSAMQGLAVGHVKEVPLPPDCATNRRIQLALLAPAVSSYSLSGSGEFFLAASEADRTLVTVNQDDRSLNFMAHATGDPDVLGLTGAYNLAADSNVYLLDTNPYVGPHHRLAYFAWSEPIANTLQPYLIYYEAARY